MQAEAAALAGCSVSAIRKWRRNRVVASRLTTRSGLRRVEVSLADVVARVGDRRQVPRPRSAPDGSTLSPGIAVVALSDLEALAVADRRAGEAEARLRTAEAEVQALVRQLAGLRRQLDAATIAPVAPPRLPPPGPPPGPRAAEAVDLARLAADLHRVYRRLDAYRADPRSWPEKADQWGADLTTYDALLLQACAARGVAVPRGATSRLTPGERARLTVALAAAGLDVRADSRRLTTSGRRVL